MQLVDIGESGAEGLPSNAVEKDEARAYTRASHQQHSAFCRVQYTESASGIGPDQHQRITILANVS
jgi:hypothetical protein